MTYRVTVQHEGVDKDGIPLARADNWYSAGNTQLVFYNECYRLIQGLRGMTPVI